MKKIIALGLAASLLLLPVYKPAFALLTGSGNGTETSDTAEPATGLTVTGDETTGDNTGTVAEDTASGDDAAATGDDAATTSDDSSATGDETAGGQNEEEQDQAEQADDKQTAPPACSGLLDYLAEKDVLVLCFVNINGMPSGLVKKDMFPQETSPLNFTKKNTTASCQAKKDTSASGLTREKSSFDFSKKAAKAPGFAKKDALTSGSVQKDAGKQQNQYKQNPFQQGTQISAWKTPQIKGKYGHK